MRTLSVASLIVIAAALGGCAQMSGASNMLLSAPASATPPGDQAGATQTTGIPPLPMRNPSRRTGASSSATASPPASGGILAGLSLKLPKLNTGPAPAPLSVVSEQPPIVLYTRLARLIHRCWLGPSNPRLPGHGSRASADSAGGGKADIDIFKKEPGRKYGSFVYHVIIEANGGGSLVSNRNGKLSNKQANLLRGDIARWAGGGDDCGR